jgi:hypothetical protein
MPLQMDHQHPQHPLLRCIQVIGVRICYQAYEGGHAQSLSRPAHPSQAYHHLPGRPALLPNTAAVAGITIVILLRAQAGDHDHTLAPTQSPCLLSITGRDPRYDIQVFPIGPQGLLFLWRV